MKATELEQVRRQAQTACGALAVLEQLLTNHAEDGSPHTRADLDRLEAAKHTSFRLVQQLEVMELDAIKAATAVHSDPAP